MLTSRTNCTTRTTYIEGPISVMGLFCLVIAMWIFPVGALRAQPTAQAQALSGGPVGSMPPDMLAAAQQWLQTAVSGNLPSKGMPLRMEVNVGALDSRLKLAACNQIEPYVPAGTRLWGKTRLGLRCLDPGIKWNVFLPITVKAFGPAWVIKGNLPAGVSLTESDAMESEVDWAEEASPIVSNPGHWVGQVALRPLTTGQPLRQSMIRAAQVFQAGAQVRVIAQGTGFQITSDGQAVSAGVIGQPARVRMENGRVMSGVVLDVRTVKLEM